MTRRVPRPKPGQWFPVAPTLTHRCCQCGAVHRWRFRVRQGRIDVAIRREGS
jgi:hypothetical protein